MGGSGGGGERAERAGMHWGPLKSSDRVHGAMKGCMGGGGGGRRAGRAERAGMHWGPLKSSDRGMGPRGHGKGAWGGGVGGRSHVGSSGKGAWERGRAVGVGARLWVFTSASPAQSWGRRILRDGERNHSAAREGLQMEQLPKVAGASEVIGSRENGSYMLCEGRQFVWSFEVCVGWSEGCSSQADLSDCAQFRPTAHCCSKHLLEHPYCRATQPRAAMDVFGIDVECAKISGEVLTLSVNSDSLVRDLKRAISNLATPSEPQFHPICQQIMWQGRALEDTEILQKLCEPPRAGDKAKLDVTLLLTVDGILSTFGLGRCDLAAACPSQTSKIIGSGGCCENAVIWRCFPGFVIFSLSFFESLLSGFFGLVFRHVEDQGRCDQRCADAGGV